MSDRTGRHLLAGIGILFLLSLASLLIGSELTCAVCGKSIEGRYIEEDGKAYHEECYRDYRAPRCAVCGKPILGARIEWEGASYHPDCYRETKQPRCAVCGKPIEGTYLVEDGKSYHPACHRTNAARCVICGEPLEGSYNADAWGNPFHARHGEDLLCPFCNRVMALSTTQGSVFDVASGRKICSLCARREVTRRTAAAEILERVRRQLQLVYPVPEGSFTWELVDRDELRSRLGSRRGAGNELGVTVGERTRRGGEVTRRIHVSFLSGVPDWLFEGVVAHELAHVWQHLQDLEDLPSDQAEGSAELAAFMILRDSGSPEGRVKIREMEESKDPAYGIGLRRALSVSSRGADPIRLREVLRKGRGWPGNP